MRILLFTVSLAASAALTACGGRIILDAADSGRSSLDHPSTSDDGGVVSVPTPAPPGDPFPVCPGTKPATGSSCPNQNQGCAYVDYDTGACESWTCDSSNHWVSSTPAGC